MASGMYTSFKRDVANGAIDLDTDTLKCMLVTSVYVPNFTAHAKRSDITNEVAGAGYVAGGVALGGKTMVADTVNDRGVFDCNDVAFGTVSVTARGAVFYKSRGGAASADELLWYIDFAVDYSSTAAPFTIQIDPAGLAFNQ